MSLFLATIPSAFATCVDQAAWVKPNSKIERMFQTTFILCLTTLDAPLTRSTLNENAQSQADKVEARAVDDVRFEIDIRRKTCAWISFSDSDTERSVIFPSGCARRRRRFIRSPRTITNVCFYLNVIARASIDQARTSADGGRGP